MGPKIESFHLRTNEIETIILIWGNKRIPTIQKEEVAKIFLALLLFQMKGFYQWDEASANVSWNTNLDPSIFTIFFLNPVLFHSGAPFVTPSALSVSATLHSLTSSFPPISPVIPCFSALSSSPRHLHFFAFSLLTLLLRVVPMEANSYRKSYILKYPYKSWAPLLSSSPPED